MAKKWYTISIDSCEDSTYINKELTPTQFKLIDSICENSKQNSRSVYMPVMEIKLIKETKEK